VAAQDASLSPWVSLSLSPLRVELVRVPNRALELKFGLSGELAAARRLFPASRRRFIACIRCEPPDPKSTTRIRSGYTRLPRSTVDRWTSSTAPVHRARQPCVKPASAPCQPSDLQQTARISPSLGHQSRRRTRATCAVRSKSSGSDPPGPGSTDPIPVNRGRFTKKTPPFLISHKCPSTLKNHYT
jgi:hypothetical protein